VGRMDLRSLCHPLIIVEEPSYVKPASLPDSCTNACAGQSSVKEDEMT
jgi:hypothetical protein